ncbi:MAG TPA: FecR domain-containing protein [Candidatus Rifleibacterium sp.]|nr:FecR domain-containing protein [Candidatus Rifleibacterium sp.]HPT45775.1 FecR domain-containing protein [Candidatus Rifleibacterium sp.]
MPDNCLKSETIQDYLEKLLPADEMAQIAAHLHDCRNCRQATDAFARLFKQATASAVADLSTIADHKTIDSVMQRLPARQGSKVGQTIPGKAERQPALIDLLRWLLVPAFVIIVAAAFLRVGRLPRQIDQSRVEFSLNNNTVTVLLGEVKLADADHIRPHSRITLPGNAVIMVQAGLQRFKFSAGAVFTLSDRQIALARGRVNCDLTGNHDGLNIKTPAVIVTPLGTSFEVEAKDWGTRVTLVSGSIEAVSITGVKRRISMPSSVYIAANGVFSDKIPQPALALPANDQMPLPQLQNTQPSSGSADSPDKLIDSF